MRLTVGGMSGLRLIGIPNGLPCNLLSLNTGSLTLGIITFGSATVIVLPKLGIET